MQGDLLTISLPYHFIYLFPKKKQSTISFEVRNFPCPNPVIDSQSQTWKDFVAGLAQQGIATRFKTKGNTDVIQGIIFEKDGCSFSGSKIDRSCSFSRLNVAIEQNPHKQEQIHLQNEPMAHYVDESYFITDLSEAISEVFSMPTPSNGVDVDELRFQKKLRNKANRKRRI